MFPTWGIYGKYHGNIQGKINSQTQLSILVQGAELDDGEAQVLSNTSKLSGTTPSRMSVPR